MKQIILITHNLRSTHNVGSLLRTADGLGIATVYLTGYTPYPLSKNDTRMPHLSRKIDAQITKTALGAEKSVNWLHEPDIISVIDELKEQGYSIVGLEQSSQSTLLTAYKAAEQIAIIVGREVEGIESEVLDLCDEIVEIPMFGQKESFNVVQAAAILLAHCRFT